MIKNKKNKWEPEYKYESISGLFTDYTGTNRDFTMVAVSIPVDDIIVCEPIINDDPIDNERTRCRSINDITKILSIGVSVRSLQDKDLGIGEQIAYGKAVKLQDHTVYVTHPGMINTKMVKALLEQESEYFKKEPGMYLKGYNHDKERYVKTGKIANAEQLHKEVGDTVSKVTNNLLK